MCICVNCRHIDKCQVYKFIEEQHKTKNKKINLDFIPINTLIQINVSLNMNSNFIDWDLKECLSFVEKPGSWIIST
uniref:Ycf34 n=1 Tax=Thuretia quercifolia TaxID=189650 RepID=A0A1Z1MKI2_9FLOR|nr:hypothetical protein [Thuretia quercifolia]ARW66389.1 hypothetical protein [Thuretia quercifolia]